MYCFFRTIFWLGIPSFFGCTDVTKQKKPEEGWYGQPKYCSKRAIHVVISFAVVSGLFSFCAPKKGQQSLRILSRYLRTLYPPRGKTRGPGLRKVRGEDGEVGYNILWYPDPTPWRKLIGYQALPESEFWSPVELRIFRNTSTFLVCSPGIFATPYWKIIFLYRRNFKMSAAPFTVEMILVFLLTLCLLHQYGNWRKQHWLVTVAVFVAWYFSFLIVFILPLDVSAVSLIILLF